MIPGGHCLEDEMVLGFLEGRLPPDEVARVETHALKCHSCQELVAAGFDSGSLRIPLWGENAMETAELSCRFLVPLLGLASKEIATNDLARFLSTWGTDARTLSDESGWVTRRFCEALVEWLAERVGVGAIIDVTLRESYSPRTMGILYPFVRAFGSPAIGYSRLPSFVGLLNRASDVDVRMRGRNRATITYRPRTEATRERSPLICEVRRAQIAAGPTVWGLPLAVIQEAECQAHGGDRCVYQVAWVEPTRWWKAAFAGVAVAVLTWVTSRHSWLTSVMATATAVTGIHLWGARRDLHDQRALADLNLNGLGRIQRLRRHAESTSAAAAVNGLSARQAPPPVAAGPAANVSLRITPLPQSGQLIAGRYRLGPLLGAGGMGLVFSATDEESNQAIALKVLRPELSADPRWVARMEREVRIARAIESPHVCKVKSFGAVDGYSFVTMELATGSLNEELRYGAAKTWSQRLKDAKAVVSGLAAIHRACIIHRDLTPQNVLRFPHDRLAIADFGLAVAWPGATTVVAGTPNRIAPEVLQGAYANYASDVWQLGMILQDVLYGPGATLDDIGGQATGATPSNDASSEVQEALRQICLSCLRDDPASRPQDAQGVARLLSEIDLVV